MDNLTEDFGAIRNTCPPRIFRYLVRLVGKSEAEDLTQEVFVRVSRGIADFQGDSTLSAPWSAMPRQGLLAPTDRSSTVKRRTHPHIAGFDLRSRVTPPAPS